MPEMSEYWRKLVAKLREGLDDDTSPEPTSEPEPTQDPMPDLAPSHELLKIVDMAKHGTLDIIELCDDDWHLLIDETTYQIARALVRDGFIVLPNIGKIEMMWGDSGPWGHVTLDEAARPDVVL